MLALREHEVSACFGADINILFFTGGLQGAGAVRRRAVLYAGAMEPPEQADQGGATDAASSAAPGVADTTLASKTPDSVPSSAAAPPVMPMKEVELSSSSARLGEAAVAGAISAERAGGDDGNVSSNLLNPAALSSKLHAAPSSILPSPGLAGARNVGGVGGLLPPPSVGGSALPPMSLSSLSSGPAALPSISSQSPLGALPGVKAVSLSGISSGSLPGGIGGSAGPLQPMQAGTGSTALSLNQPLQPKPSTHPLSSASQPSGAGMGGSLSLHSTNSLNMSSIAMSAGAGYVVRTPGQPGSKSDRRAGEAQLKETDALEYLNQVKLQFGDNPEIYNKFLDIMKDFKSHTIDTQKVIERVSRLFHGHQTLILGFNTFLPQGYKIEVRQPHHMIGMQKKPAQANKGGKAAPEFDHAYSYVSKIKQRFAHQQSVYQQFLQILQRYKEEGFAIARVKAQVAELFAGHEDLLGEFGNFLPDPAGSKAGQMSKAQKKKPSGAGQNRGMAIQAQPGHTGYDKGKFGQRGFDSKGQKYKPEKKAEELTKEAMLLEKIKDKLMTQSSIVYNDFLKCLSLYAQEVFTAAELALVLDDMFASSTEMKGLLEELKGYIGLREAQTKYSKNIPMSEIDFSNCEHMGTSYRSLPSDYPIPVCSGRTALCEAVLCDEWVSVPSGSEDFSYSNYRKNQYEESLFKCEDDRFELDMLIETNASTIRTIEVLLEDGEKDRGRGKPDLRSLKAFHFQAIERVYGDHGQEIVDHIKRAPLVAINVVLPRLRQKDEEWRKARRDMNKIWRDVYKDNYHKSLDHRSFYFKQLDKKGLTAKTFVYEIKDAKDQTHEQRSLLFDMSRSDIHQDIFDVVSHAAAANLHEGPEARVRKFFLAFLHVFFGLKHRDIEELKTRTRTLGSKKKRVEDDANDKQSGYLSLRTRQLTKNEDGKDEKKGGEEGDGTLDKDEIYAEEEDKKDVDTKKEEDGATVRRSRRSSRGGDDETGTGGDPDETMNDSENDDDEDDDDEEDDLWQAVHSMAEFSPIKCFTISKQEKEDLAVPFVSDTGTLFYGNLPCYVFFRLYQKLYERLLKAKTLAHDLDHKEEQQRGDGSDPAESSRGTRGDREDKGDADDSMGGAEKNVYQRFMHMLVQLVKGDIETSKFEDDCRLLLGTNSYELYTLEKVVEKIMGQVQSVTHDSSAHTGARHLALLEYEHLRAAGEGTSAQPGVGPLGATYFGNACNLSGEEGCYSFCYSTASNQLTIGLLEVDASKEGSKADFKKEERREERCNDFLAPGSDLRDFQPFLARNLKKCVARMPSQAVALEGLHVHSELAMLVDEDDRVTFRPFTVDCQVRSAQRRVPDNYKKNARMAKVSAWQEARLLQIPAEAEALKKEAEEEAAARAQAEEDEEDEDDEGEDKEDGDDDDDEEENEKSGVEGEGDEDGEGDGEDVGGLAALMGAMGDEEEVKKEDERGDDMAMELDAGAVEDVPPAMAPSGRRRESEREDDARPPKKARKGGRGTRGMDLGPEAEAEPAPSAAPVAGGGKGGKEKSPPLSSVGGRGSRKRGVVEEETQREEEAKEEAAHETPAPPAAGAGKKKRGADKEEAVPEATGGGEGGGGDGTLTEEWTRSGRGASKRGAAQQASTAAGQDAQAEAAKESEEPARGGRRSSGRATARR